MIEIDAKALAGIGISGNVAAVARDLITMRQTLRS